MDQPGELDSFVRFMEANGFRKAKELYHQDMLKKTALPLDIVFVNERDV